MNETKKKKRGLPLALTIVAYALIIVVLLAVAPVLCPAVFGYQTRLVGSCLEKCLISIRLTDSKTSPCTYGDKYVYL